MRKKRFFAAVLCALLLLCLLPGAAMAAPATSVTIGAVTLNATTPYYHNGVSTADADPIGANAAFLAGTLTLNGYNGLNISATGDLTVIVNGVNNTISGSYALQMHCIAPEL